MCNCSFWRFRWFLHTHQNVFNLLACDMCLIWHMLHNWYGITHHYKVICTGLISDVASIIKSSMAHPWFVYHYFIIFFPSLFLNCCTYILFLPLASNIFMTLRMGFVFWWPYWRSTHTTDVWIMLVFSPFSFYFFDWFILMFDHFWLHLLI